MGKLQREWLVVRTVGVAESQVELGSARVEIGRGSGSGVVLADTYASAVHAELSQRNGSRSVRDLGSTNGTRLNGLALLPRVPHTLHDGDVIQIGTSELEYHCLPEGVAVAVPAPAPAARPARRVVGRAIRRALKLVTALLCLALIVSVALWLLAPPRVSVLVLGSDARPAELRRGEVGRTDTLLTVVADRWPAGVVMVSVPRDLWVTLPGGGEDRINTAYARGGPRTAERAVSDVLGVSVDRYLVIGLQGVRDVVDAAGGVDIDVERPIHDDAYPTDDYGTVVVDIPAGRQHMDGETALRYARTRHQDSDFGRIARQQQVMLAVRTRLMQPSNWWRVPGVISAVHNATQTDLSVLDMVTLAAAFGTSSAPPDRLAVDLALVEEFRGGDGAYLLRARPALRQRVAAVLDPTIAAIEVLNGSGTAGLASQAADRLRGQGLKVARVGDASRHQPDTTIEVRPGLTRAGHRAASALGLPQMAVRESAALPEGVDVRVTLGERGL